MSDQTTDQHVTKLVQSFLVDECGLSEGDFDADTLLFSSSLLSSLELVDMLLFIEQKFDIRVPTPEVTTEKFDTVNLIANFIQNSKSA